MGKTGRQIARETCRKTDRQEDRHTVSFMDVMFEMVVPVFWELCPICLRGGTNTQGEKHELDGTRFALWSS